jgi:hypothetical protein
LKNYINPRSKTTWTRFTKNRATTKKTCEAQ